MILGQCAGIANGSVILVHAAHRRTQEMAQSVTRARDIGGEWFSLLSGPSKADFIASNRLRGRLAVDFRGLLREEWRISRICDEIGCESGPVSHFPRDKTSHFCYTTIMYAYTGQ
jgi:hypothetical protein